MAAFRVVESRHRSSEVRQREKGRKQMPIQKQIASARSFVIYFLGVCLIRLFVGDVGQFRGFSFGFAPLPLCLRPSLPACVSCLTAALYLLGAMHDARTQLTNPVVFPLAVLSLRGDAPCLFRPGGGHTQDHSFVHHSIIKKSFNPPFPPTAT